MQEQLLLRGKKKKRKLLLTDRGDGPVDYKLKKSKLKQNIKAGFI